MKLAVPDADSTLHAKTYAVNTVNLMTLTKQHTEVVQLLADGIGRESKSERLIVSSELWLMALCVEPTMAMTSLISDVTSRPPRSQQQREAKTT